MPAGCPPHLEAPDRPPAHPGRHEQQEGQQHREGSRLPHLAELGAVQHDHGEGLVAGAVEQARHGHLVQRRQEADQPGRQQCRRQRAEHDGSYPAEQRGAARAGGRELVRGQPVQRSGHRPVCERPELREVGQQDDQQRVPQPPSVGDQQADGKGAPRQHEGERHQGPRGPAEAGAFQGGHEATEHEQDGGGRQREQQAAAECLAVAHRHHRLEVAQGPVPRHRRQTDRRCQRGRHQRNQRDADCHEQVGGHSRRDPTAGAVASGMCRSRVGRRCPGHPQPGAEQQIRRRHDGEGHDDQKQRQHDRLDERGRVTAAGQVGVDAGGDGGEPGG